MRLLLLGAQLVDFGFQSQTSSSATLDIRMSSTLAEGFTRLYHNLQLEADFDLVNTWWRSRVFDNTVVWLVLRQEGEVSSVL